MVTTFSSWLEENQVTPDSPPLRRFMAIRDALDSVAVGLQEKFGSDATSYRVSWGTLQKDGSRLFRLDAILRGEQEQLVPLFHGKVPADSEMVTIVFPGPESVTCSHEAPEIFRVVGRHFQRAEVLQRLLELSLRADANQ